MDRSTSLNVSGKMKSSSSDHASQDFLPAAKQLSEAFALLSKQLVNLNTLLANGVPMRVDVHTPAPQFTVNVPEITVKVPDVHFEPTISVEPTPIRVEPRVEPPVVNMQAPVVRVDHIGPKPQVELVNEVHTPAPYFSKDEIWAIVAVAMVFLVVLSLGLVMIGVRLWSQ